MEYRVFSGKIALRLDVGDEILKAVKEVCEKEDIKLASVTGLGAVSKAVVGLYRVSEQEYVRNVFEQDMELVSLIGNISQKDGEVYLHLHASLADEKGRVVGGHLNEAVISVTGEIWIDPVDGCIGRRVDEKTGLNVWDFSEHA